MNSPATARRGNRISAGGMIVAVAFALALVAEGATMDLTRWLVLIVGALIGAGVGLWAARSVLMTAIPQLVSLFNAVGGGAAAMIALADYARRPTQGSGSDLATVLDVIIGSITFLGSLLAAAKLQGYASQPVHFTGGRVLNAALAVVAVGSAVAIVARVDSLPVLVLTVVAALGVGALLVLPIGGADMPVVISLLNAFTGTAVAMAGFVIDNPILIVAGALVGASGAILTKLMADAMNRSIPAIMTGGFGTGAGGVEAASSGAAQVRSVQVDDAALQLAYAERVVMVPGYGLAAAQAQHELRELASVLEERGVEVSYAIHPVAGRMPGHMNVLLAEANVPYDQLKEMDEINPEMPRADVALVVGANDVTNPAARRPGNAVSGMPIIDVDRAKSVIVIKRSMASGYAGIDNELYADPRTAMLFSDAKKGLAALTAAAKSLVS
jgi:NAD(P) transhydrogenase subunit beta